MESALYLGKLRHRRFEPREHAFEYPVYMAFLDIQESLTTVTRISLTDFESLGMHYTRTLSLWRERFFQRLAEMRGMGFDERFQRTWDFHMSWSEGAFRERYINVVHLLMAKNGTPKRVIGDPILSAGVLAPERGLS
jgi:hypothetical protein